MTSRPPPASGRSAAAAATARTGSGSVVCADRGVVQAHGEVAETVARRDDGASRAGARRARPRASSGSAPSAIARVDAHDQGHGQARPPGRATRPSPPGSSPASTGPACRRTTRTVKRPTTSRTDAMAARAARASTPHAAAATAASKALDWLKRPGSVRRTGGDGRPPSRPAPRRPAASHEGRLGVGPGEAAARAGPAVVHEGDAALAGGAAHRIVLPAQAGTDPVHVGAPHHTPRHERVVGFATTWVRGAAASAARQLPATMRTSFVRSSWSRERFSSTTVAGAVADKTRGR